MATQQRSAIMPLTVEEDQELTEILTALEPLVEHMGDWDKKFTTDCVARHQQYGSTMFFSPKQWAQLHRIYDEQVGHGDPDDDPEGLDDEIPF